jgi:Ca2+-binding EF-hand superfamily protein
MYRIINNAAPAFPNNFKNALETFDVNADGLIDYHEFVEIERRFPIMLFPAFRLQDAMQRKSLGELRLLCQLGN